MSEITLGILGGGQLGSMLSIAAKKLNIKTIIFCDNQDAPAQNFCEEFIYANYNDKNKLDDFAKKVDVITYEFENIPFKTLKELNTLKTVLPIQIQIGHSLLLLSDYGWYFWSVPSP